MPPVVLFLQDHGSTSWLQITDPGIGILSTYYKVVTELEEVLRKRKDVVDGSLLYLFCNNLWYQLEELGSDPLLSSSSVSQATLYVVAREPANKPGGGAFKRLQTDAYEQVLTKSWKDLLAATCHDDDKVDIDLSDLSDESDIIPGTDLLTSSLGAVKVNVIKLSLPEGSYFVCSKYSELMVRHSYRELAYIILGVRTPGLFEAGDAGHFCLRSLLNKRRTENKGLVINIAGTPGIGKSFFGYYLLFLVGKEFPETSIIWQNSAAGEFYLFETDKVELLPNRDIVAYLSPSDFYFCDGADPIQCRATTFLFRSNKDLQLDKIKFVKDIDETFYMDLWTLQELVCARALKPYKDIEMKMIKKQFLKWGGIPRTVLEKSNSEGWEDNLQKMLQDSLPNLGQGLFLEMCPHVPKVISSSIMHLEVIEGTCFRKTQAIFGSKVIFDKVLELYKADYKRKVTEFGKAFHTNMEARGYIGQIYKRGVHNLFKRCDKRLRFKQRKLHPIGIEIKCSVPISYYAEDVTMENLKNGKVGEYCVMRRCNAAFDAVLRLSEGSFVFQVTASLNQPVSYVHLLKLHKTFDIKRFYFVVPKEVYSRFEAQQLKHGASSVDIFTLYGIEQWVLEVDWGHLKLQTK